jgi:acyl-CoA dehydrogenase
MADKSFLDWPFFTDAHRALAVKLDRWAQDVLPPLVDAEHLAGHDDAALDAAARSMVAALAEAGFLRYCVPGAEGGAYDGLDGRSLCLIRDALARRSGLVDFAFVMQGLGSGPISQFGSNALRSRYLPGVASGKRIAAFALSEPAAGSDPGAIATEARRDGESYVLNGTKTWISNAGIADFYTVFVRTGEGPGAKGLSAFVVDADTPGLRVAERISVIAPHPLGTLAFEDCRVPAANLIGAPGDGFKVGMANLDVFRPTVGAAALGFARRALDEALARTAERRIGGQRLADYQLTQAAIADMAVQVDAAALLVYRAGWAKDASGGGRTTREGSMAKLYATEAAQQVIDRAVQLFGGLGVVSGMTVERLYREIRALRIYEGASEVQKLIIAGQVRRAFEQGGTA